VTSHLKLQVAEDLYRGLLRFFDEQPHLQRRPLFITGESYAGKYVPSIGKAQRSASPQPMPLSADGVCRSAFHDNSFAPLGHFILQMQQQAGGPRHRGPWLRFSRRAPTTSSMRRPPNFRLAGLAIGDGLTDPLTQVLTQVLYR
jgi:vitellogenic carboxypeptidase-like protein